MSVMGVLYMCRLFERGISKMKYDHYDTELSALELLNK